MQKNGENNDTDVIQWMGAAKEVNKVSQSMAEDNTNDSIERALKRDDEERKKKQALQKKMQEEWRKKYEQDQKALVEKKEQEKKD